MMRVVDKVEEAKTRWLSFCTHVAYAMLAGDLSAAYHVMGDRRRAQAETRVAIGEAAAVISRALDIVQADPAWQPICDAMVQAADIHVSGLEGQLSEFLRSGRVRTQQSRADQQKHAAMGVHWTVAALEMRTLYASLGGDPNELPTFALFYETMKSGGLTVPSPLTIPPWPAMEN